MMNLPTFRDRAMGLFPNQAVFWSPEAARNVEIHIALSGYSSPLTDERGAVSAGSVARCALFAICIGLKLCRGQNQSLATIRTGPSQFRQPFLAITPRCLARRFGVRISPALMASAAQFSAVLRPFHIPHYTTCDTKTQVLKAERGI